jgi:hypothetical protein
VIDNGIPIGCTDEPGCPGACCPQCADCNENPCRCEPSTIDTVDVAVHCAHHEATVALEALGTDADDDTVDALNDVLDALETARAALVAFRKQYPR